MRTSTNILFLIYFICVIPLIIIYVVHGNQELEEAAKLKEMGNESKSIKTNAEGWFLRTVAFGYAITALAIIMLPNNRIAYIIIIVGTIAVIAIWLGRSEYGIPIPGTDLEITKYTVGWEGFWTKTLQAIMLVPVAILLDRTRQGL